MKYTGHIEKGAIVLDHPPQYPDGAEVEVEVTMVASPPPRTSKELTSLYERWHSFIGIAEGLPEDLATNHDFYAHGGTRR